MRARAESRSSFPISTVLFALLWLSGGKLMGAAADTLQASESFLAAIRSSPGCPDCWNEATITQCASLGDPSNGWSVCPVVSRQEQKGYILMRELDGSSIPVMFSASSLPGAVIKALNPPENESEASAPPRPPANLSKLPLVRTYQREDSRIKVNSLSCCVASLFWLTQRQFRVPCFYSIDLSVPFMTFDPESKLLVAPQPETAGELTQYWEQRAQVYNDSSVRETVPLPASAPAPHAAIARTRDNVELFGKMGPIIRNQLKADLSFRARQRLIDEEFDLAGTAMEPSRRTQGQIAGLVVQTYLEDHHSLQEGISAFSRSRGLKLRVASGPVSALTAEKVPCVVELDAETGLLIAGLEQAPNPAWALVVVPETVGTQNHQLGTSLPVASDSHARALAITRSVNAAAKGSHPAKQTPIRASSRPALSPERQKWLADLRQSMKAQRQARENEVICSDDNCELPDALLAGAHWIRLNALVSTDAYWLEQRDAIDAH